MAACLFHAAGAQTRVNADSLFNEARMLAFGGKGAEARALCRSILIQAPSYTDVRILIARTYSWEKQYDSSRVELKRVLDAQPQNADALDALIDVELWSGNPREALKYCLEALSHYPDNENFMLKQARSMDMLGDYKGASQVLSRLLEINPANAYADSVLKNIRYNHRLNKVTGEYYLDLFDQTFSPWHLGLIQYSRKTPYGSLIFRAQYASRFNREGFQFETDLYPNIRKGTYLYLNAGFSGTSLFPKLRLGGEVNQKLPKGFECSLGLRYMQFPSTDVFIFTGSLGKYYQDYWFSFRPYLVPKAAGISRSGSLTVRRYLGNADSFVGLMFGLGASPDDRIDPSNPDPSLAYQLQSYRFRVEFNKRIHERYILKFAMGRQNEEYRLDNFRNQYSFTLGGEVLF